MLYIKKGAPPQPVSLKIAAIKRKKVWKELPEEAPVDPDKASAYTKVLRDFFDNDIPKSELREALLKEQHHLCVYCMRRLHNEDDNRNIRIEHWYPLSKKKATAIDYRNLLAACSGSMSQNGKLITCCDNSKGSTEIELDPRDQRMMSLINYESNGRIYVAKGEGWDEEQIARFQNEVDNVLLLNGPTDAKEAEMNSDLQMARSKAFKGCKKRFDQWRQQNKLSVSKVQSLIDDIESKEKYPEYAGVMLFYYKRWLNNHKS